MTLTPDFDDCFDDFLLLRRSDNVARERRCRRFESTSVVESTLVSVGIQTSAGSDFLRP